MPPRATMTTVAVATSMIWRRFIAYHYASYLHRRRRRRPDRAATRISSFTARRAVIAGHTSHHGRLSLLATLQHATDPRAPRFNIPRRTKADISSARRRIGRPPETLLQKLRAPIYARNIHWKCYRALR